LGYDINIFVVVAVFGLLFILLPFLIRSEVSALFSFIGAVIMIYLFLAVGSAGAITTSYNAGVGNAVGTTEIILIPLFLGISGFLVSILKVIGKI
jgi:hypothetical protein